MVIAQNPHISPGWAWLAAPIRNQHLVIISRIQRPRQKELLLVIDALDLKRLGFCSGKNRQQEGSEDGNNCDDYQQLN